jgi:uncharacterized glyoxalase superfamily protein PhnB
MLKNRSIPACTVVPVVAYPDLNEATHWLCNTFGFTLRLRIGDHRAQLNIGEGAVVLRRKDAIATHWSESVMVRVEDVDGHHQKARERGARILAAPADYPYGERQYSVEDVAGHQWTFSQSIADVDAAEWGGTAGEL